MTDPISVEAEAAVKQLMRTLAQHRRHEAVLGSTSSLPRGRLRSLPSDQQAVTIRRQATLVRLVSIVEAFTTTSLVTRVESHAPPSRTDILGSIYANAENQAVGSWKGLETSYKQWFKISIDKCGAWKRLQATHDARNAIAHGLGDLTRRMTRGKTDPRTRLKLIDIAVTGIRIEIKESSLRKVADAGRDFIEELDVLLQHYDVEASKKAAAALAGTAAP
jgi:hypothetical protein